MRCPAGWRSVTSGSEVFCESPYQGTGTCCSAKAKCDSLTATAGFVSDTDPPPEMASHLPGFFIRVIQFNGTSGNFHCYTQGWQAGFSYWGGISVYGCTAPQCADTSTCCASPACPSICSGKNCSDCGCARHYWCYFKRS